MLAEFISHQSQTSSDRQALFSRFSQRALRELVEWQEKTPQSARPLILLTGGFCSADLMTSALNLKHADLLGVGRLSVLYPELPKLLMQGSSLGHADTVTIATCADPWRLGLTHTSTSVTRRVVRFVTSRFTRLWGSIPSSIKPQFPRLVGAGTEMAWYIVSMRCLRGAALDEHVSLPGSGLEAVVCMWLYIAPGPWASWTLCLTVLITALLIMYGLG